MYLFPLQSSCSYLFSSSLACILPWICNLNKSLSGSAAELQNIAFGQEQLENMAVPMLPELCILKFSSILWMFKIMLCIIQIRWCANVFKIAMLLLELFCTTITGQKGLDEVWVLQRPEVWKPASTLLVQALLSKPATTRLSPKRQNDKNWHLSRFFLKLD